MNLHALQFIETADTSETRAAFIVENHLQGCRAIARKSRKRGCEDLSIFETMKARRSIHTFTDKEVDRETLEQIFTYASYAPTHYLTEAWQMDVYEQSGKKKLIDAIMNSYQRIGLIANDEKEKTVRMIESMKKFMHAIPHHIVIYFDRPEDPVRYEEEFASVSAFIQNAQLAAWELGVGMLWTITPYMHDPVFLEEIGLSENAKIVGVMQVGYPKNIPRSRKRTPIKEKMKFMN